MKTIVLEIRDRITLIPVVATKLEPANEAEKYLLGRAGFRAPLVLVTHLNSLESAYSPYQWKGGSRTMNEAHNYIESNFEELQPGDVIDVEFVLGETTISKRSEAHG